MERKKPTAPDMQNALGEAKGIVLPQGIQLAEAMPQQAVEAEEPEASIAADLDVPVELASKVQELQERVNRTPAKDRKKAAEDARGELETAIREHVSKEKAEITPEKAHLSHKAELAQAHRELYKSDTLYQARTEAITELVPGERTVFARR